MAAQGIVVQPSEGLVSNSSTTPGRSYALKLLGGATGDSIMLFEQIPAYLDFFGFGRATADELRALAKISY